jgi:small neutral amino acid transporter SnatA (MarC family)
MSAEPLDLSLDTVPLPALPVIAAPASAATDVSAAESAEKGLLIALLLMVLLGVAAMLVMN